MNKYRIDGKFVSKVDFERTYGTLEPDQTVRLGADLSDPEVQQSIRDISHGPKPEYHPYPYKQIHTTFYILWVLSSAFAIFVSFWLGSLLYR